MARAAGGRVRAGRRPRREGVKAPGTWSSKGLFADGFIPGRHLTARRGLRGGDAAFESALVLVLNTVYENGFIHADSLAPAAAFLRESYRAWGADAMPGSSWADVFFPNRTPGYNLRPGIDTTTIFVPTNVSTMLFAADTGLLLQVSPAPLLAQRSLTDFVTQPEVAIEVFVDLFVIVCAAFGVVGNVDRLRQGAQRLIFGNPRLLQLLQRITQFFGANSQSLDELVPLLRQLFELLFKAGIGADLLQEFVSGWDWWDVLVFFLGLLAILFPASAGVKIAFIIGKLVDTGLELSRKYERYQKGEPLTPGPK